MGTWFVTGAGAGIGRQVTEAALGRGDAVVATSRSIDSLQELVGVYPTRLVPVELDVRDEAAVQAGVKAAVDAFGRIDVVVNNAGYGLFGSVEDTTDAQARALFDTAVFGLLNVVRAVLPVLPVLRGQRSGRIVQMSSNFRDIAHSGTGVLAAAKHAVGGLSKALHAELAPLGVGVTLVQPGAVRTGFVAEAQVAAMTPDYAPTVGATMAALGALPASAFLEPEAVAAAVLAVADAADPPLRLVLGAMAERDVLQGLTAAMHDLDTGAARTRAAQHAAPSHPASGGAHPEVSSGL